MDLEHTQSRFGTTRWTLVAVLRSGGAADQRRAEEELVRVYWPPVYGFLRATGHGSERAAELTQAFFVDVVLRRRLFDIAEKESGRLRTLLLTALKRYLIDQHRRVVARPDGGAVTLGDYQREEDLHPVDAAAVPEKLFERRWLVAMLEEALARVERHYGGCGKAGHWELFEMRVVRPAARGAAAPSLATAAAECGFRSAADAAAAIQTVKKRVLHVLREVVGENAADGDEVREEFRALSDLMS